MTKANITEYDNTAANNTDVQDVPLGENLMYPSHVNNAFREIMADLADINDGTVAMTSPSAGSINITGNITVGGTVDGRDVATDGTKLDGIETGATADQTAAEIKTAYESNSDTNAFTDALQTKLNGIETAATADQTGAEIATAISGQTVAALTITSATVNGGTITGITDLAIADGGTGASTAAAARTNLDVDQAGTAVALAIALG